MASATTLNLWKSYTYYDPEIVLRGLRRVQLTYDLQAIPQDVANLRTHALKEVRERREAALFSFGMGVRLGTKVIYAPVEDSDYDFVTAWVGDRTLKLCPVQLKELVPEELNPRVSLAEIFEKVKRGYPTSAETVVAIHFNQIKTLDVPALEVPDLPVAEVFLFGSVVPDQSRWVLVGDLLGDPIQTFFDHPGPGKNAA